MESAGGVLPAALAASRAVYTIESGPAAGVIAAAAHGVARGFADLISFDMGGTTAKAGLVREGRPGITHEFQVGGKGSFGGRRAGTGIPIKVPAIDLAEVGSGGGSIAWVDAGTLRVGPLSAAADPGPACYGRGGVRPTVTDANLVLGYLDPGGFAEFGLSADAARAAISEYVAQPLGVSVVEAAAAIHDIANAQMSAAIHVVTVRRGIDPRGFTLVALGGAAPTHVARLAERFGIGRVLMPPYCGVGSAAGLLHADLAIERARTFLAPAATITSAASSPGPAALSEICADLETSARTDLSVDSWRFPHQEGSQVRETPRVNVVRSIGIRYIGQAHAFTVELASGPVTRETVTLAVEEFYKRYRESYGIDLRDPVELTTVRVRVTIPAGNPADLDASNVSTPLDRSPASRSVWLDGEFVEVPLVAREECAAGTELAGPYIITEPSCSLLVPAGWRATVDECGGVLLEAS
jgi:N-methylhydantoinase A